MVSPERPADSCTATISTGFWSQRFWRFNFPVLEPWAVWPGLGLGSLAPDFIHYMWMWDCLFHQPPHCCHTASSLPWLPISTPPTCLDEYGFFKFLVVGLPYSSIFWQFWAFFVLRLVVILLMVVQGGKACLFTPPFWLEVLCNLSFKVNFLRSLKAHLDLVHFF